MGERKGVNKYYPPDYDPAKGGLNKWQGTHALRERASKLHLGLLVVRFEMPFNIWCGGCGRHIGMGVRYNADKSKIGMYYTTPIYQFRMKCHLCDNYFIIKTDPANLDYVVVSGARRQERRFDPAENGTVVPDERATIQKMATDSMFKLEHGSKDADKSKDAAPVLARLERSQDRLWDDFAANKRLRDQFRVTKRAASAAAARDAELLRRSSLDIALVQETDDDRRLAQLSKLRDPLGMEERRRLKRDEINSKPVLGAVAASNGGFANLSFPSAAKSRDSVSIGVTVKRRTGSVPEGKAEKRLKNGGTSEGVVVPAAGLDSRQCSDEETGQLISRGSSTIPDTSHVSPPNRDKSPDLSVTNHTATHTPSSDIQHHEDSIPNVSVAQSPVLNSRSPVRVSNQSCTDDGTGRADATNHCLPADAVSESIVAVPTVTEPLSLVAGYSSSDGE